ncbi:MAG: hypothetical protein AB1635_17690 [Acidobacteriota bacterium]
MRLYPRWILANGAAECLGLGATLALGAWAAQRWPGIDETAGGVIGAALAAIAAGTLLEGVLLGACQAWAIRSAYPAFPAGAWVRATAIGAALAWTAGMIPSTVMNVAGDAARGAAGSEPPLAVTLALAAAMGLVLGPFLGVPQGRVLRRFGGTVRRWVSANSLAWAAGMPVVFIGTALVDEASGAARIAAVVIASTLGAGLVVGAVHGRFLPAFTPESIRGPSAST